MGRNIAIFGGSFNPPHEDHAGIIRWLATGQSNRFDKVIVAIVDNNAHAHGKDLAPYSDRLKMVQHMLAPMRGLTSIGTPIEVVMQSEEFTVDFLEGMKTDDPDAELHLVVGADILNDTDRWERWDDVRTLARIIQVSRKGSKAEASERQYDMGSRGFSSTQIRKQLSEGDLTYLIGKGGMLCGLVFDYIEKAGLYGYGVLGETEHKVQMGVISIPITALDEYIEKGNTFNITGLIRKFVGVEKVDVDGEAYVNFRFVHDTSMEGKIRNSLRVWYRDQTRAWAAGDEFTTPKPIPRSPGVFGIKTGSPVMFFPSDATHIGRVGDYDFFEVKPDSILGGMFGGVLGF